MAAAPLMQVNGGCDAGRLFVGGLKRYLAHDAAQEWAC